MKLYIVSEVFVVCFGGFFLESYKFGRNFYSLGGLLEILGEGYGDGDMLGFFSYGN